MRLINADALLDRLINAYKENETYSVASGLAMAYDMVQGQPTVDAEPVKHGKWIKYAPADFPYPYHHDDYECSVCSTLWASKEIKNMHYCPSCGAKMDEVKDVSD